MATPRVQLAEALLQRYKSCVRTDLSLEPDVTILIGPNGAGKTNIMHGLRLIGRVARRITRLREGEHSPAGSQIKADFQLKKKTVGLKIAFNDRAEERGSRRRLNRLERWNFSSLDAPQGWLSVVSAEMFLHSGMDDGNYALVKDAEGKPSPVQLSKSAQDTYDAINLFRQRIQYYSASQFTNPTACPTSFEVDEEGISADLVSLNRNKHLSFLHKLFRTSTENKELYASYLSLVGRDGIKLIDGIRWQRTTFSNASYEVRSGGKLVNQRRKRTLIIPIVIVSGHQLSFDQLSEGTFRTLATIFHIMTDRGSLLLLEEPEVCVHHGLLASLIEIIKNHAHQKQIVISTHSEAVLDAFRPEQVRLVSNTIASGTKANRLSSVMSDRKYSALKSYLQNEGNLGEYWRLSGFGK